MLPFEIYCCSMVITFILSLVYYEQETLKTYSPLDFGQIIPII